MATVGFACRCGAVTGEVVGVTPAETTHIVCHCRDCRSAYTHLSEADPGKVGILHTRQDRIRILSGRSHLRVFRLTPRGALRWYAACCGVPLLLTPLKPRLTHVGVNVDRLGDPSKAGKILAETFIPMPNSQTRSKGLLRTVTRLLSRMLAANMDGSWRGTPFFADDGTPIMVPDVLTAIERNTATGRLLP